MLIQIMRGSRRITTYKNAPKRTIAFILLSRRIFKVFVKASERRRFLMKMHEMFVEKVTDHN